MKYGSLLLVLGLLFGAVGVSAQEAAAKPAAQAAKGPKPITYQNWDVLCEKDKKGKKHCQMFQNIGLKVSDEVTLRMQVKLGYITGQKNPVLLMTLPLGVALPPGVQLQVDAGKPLKMAFELCDPVGCRAGTQAKPSLINSLKKGNKAKISFAIQRQAGTVPVSLLGFTKALKHIQGSK